MGEPLDMMGFIDFTIGSDGKIKVNRAWSSPKVRQPKPVKKVNKFEGVSNDGEIEL